MPAAILIDVALGAFPLENKRELHIDLSAEYDLNVLSFVITGADQSK